MTESVSWNQRISQVSRVAVRRASVPLALLSLIGLGVVGVVGLLPRIDCLGGAVVVVLGGGACKGVFKPVKPAASKVEEMVDPEECERPASMGPLLEKYGIFNPNPTRLFDFDFPAYYVAKKLLSTFREEPQALLDCWSEEVICKEMGWRGEEALTLVRHARNLFWGKVKDFKKWRQERKRKVAEFVAGRSTKRVALLRDQEIALVRPSHNPLISE